LTQLVAHTIAEFNLDLAFEKSDGFRQLVRPFTLLSLNYHLENPERLVEIVVFLGPGFDFTRNGFSKCLSVGIG
jgi:hypothetical protein